MKLPDKKHNFLSFVLFMFCSCVRLRTCVSRIQRRRGLQHVTSEKYWKKPGALRGFGIHEETKEKIEISFSIAFGTAVEMVVLVTSSISLSIP